MNTKRKLLNISNIFSYVSSFIYFVICAANYSMDNKIYWMYFAFAFVCLYTGLLISCIKDHMYGTCFEKKQKVCLLVYSIIGILSPISTLFGLLAIFNKDNSPLTIKEYKAKVKEDKTRKPFMKRKSTLLAIVSFVAIYLASFVGSLVETSGYSVEINKFYLTKEMSERYSQPINGKSYVIKSDEMVYCVNEYKPKNASNFNKLPVIFVNGGYTRSKEAMSQFASELSRRGAVVYALDSACHGESTYGGYYLNSKDVETKAGTSDGHWGLDYLVSYIYNNTDDYDYIDRDRFGSLGHSQGGAATMGTACDMAGNSYEESILKAIQISGYCTNLNYYSGLYKCNAMLTWGYYEEGYQSGSYETYFQHFVNNANGYGVFNYNQIDVNKGYGDMSNGTYRIVTRPNTNHFLTIYDSYNMEMVCDFFNEALNMNSNIKGSNQVWMIREVTSAISFIAAFSMIVGICGILINTKLFKPVKLDDIVEVETITIDNVVTKKPKSAYSKIKFFTLSIFTAIVACFDYYPCCELGLKLFSETASANYSFQWPCKMFNGVMLWALINGLLGLIVFFVPKIIESIVYKIKHKEKMEVKEYKHLKLSFKQILLTLLLVLILFVIFFANLQLIYILFHQEYKLLMVICSPINYRAFVAYLIYVPFFIFFYIQNSLRVNLGIGLEGYKEPINKLIAILGNSLGLIFCLFIEYYIFYQTGKVFNSDTTYFNVLYGVTIMMMLLPILNRAFYKKTNNVFVGALTALLIFIYISVSSTCNLIPLGLL